MAEMNGCLSGAIVGLVLLLVPGCPLASDPPTGDSVSVRLYRDGELVNTIGLGDGFSRIDAQRDFDGQGFPGFRLTRGCQYGVMLLVPTDEPMTDFAGLLMLDSRDESGAVESFIFCGGGMGDLCSTIDDPFIEPVESFEGSIEVTVTAERIVASFDVTIGAQRAEGAVDLPRDFLHDDEMCLTVEP